MEWDSPWGKGFPGWHLECSVIALHSLGEQIDIHTGGIDHIPVHHTNEIAQTEAVTGKQFVRYWFHNNHMKSSDAKMSKSLGNIYTLYDLLARGYELAAFKLMTLSSHYQTEGNFTWEILDAAASRLKHWREVADLIWQYNDTVNASHQKLDELTNAPDKLLAILENNLDTPGALKFIDEILSKNVSVDLDHNHSQKFRVFFEAIYSLLGINCVGEDITDEQKKLLNQRNEARVKKDWQESDRIRDLLLESNLGINDTKAGQKWFRLT